MVYINPSISSRAASAATLRPATPSLTHLLVMVDVNPSIGSEAATAATPLAAGPPTAPMKFTRSACRALSRVPCMPTFRRREGKGGEEVSLQSCTLHASLNSQPAHKYRPADECIEEFEQCNRYPQRLISAHPARGGLGRRTDWPLLQCPHQCTPCKRNTACKGALRASFAV